MGKITLFIILFLFNFSVNIQIPWLEIIEHFRLSNDRVEIEKFSPFQDSCETPSNSSVTNITLYEAEISWAETNGATSWEILYGEQGFDMLTEGTSIIDDDGVATEVISNLDPDTPYDFYIRTICDTDIFSEWTALNSFTTLAIPENDSCENAIEVNTFPYNNEQDAFGATNNDGFLSQCGGLGMNDGVWYLVEGNDHEITVTVEDTPDWDSEVAIYSGECGNFTCVTSIDIVDDVQELNFVSEVGINYFINIGYYSGTLDNDEGFFSIEVDSPGPAPCGDPSDINITQIESSSANVSWTPNGEATTWKVLYGEINFNLETGGESTIVENNPEINLTDLLPDTTYEFYVKALCEENESDLIGPQTFTTQEVLCNPPSNLTVTNISENSANLSWTENGEATSWQVFYGGINFNPETEGESIIVENNPELILTDLPPNTTYEFFVEALCTESETELSASETFTTLEAICSSPSNITITNITENSANVSWTENGEATSWQVIYGEINFNLETEGEIMIVENNPEINLTELLPDTTYEFYVKALCEENESDLIGSQTFTTLEAVCNSPSNITITNITENSANVSWTENGEATSWVIVYEGINFNPLTDGMTKLDDDGEVGETLENLSPNTEYEVYVYSICENMDSELSTSENFTTQNLSIKQSAFNSFNYYPNPVSSTLNLEADKIINQIEIFSVTGRKVMLIQPNSLTKEVNLESMANGIYLMKITIENQAKTFKILKE